jgi:hypothetical protein
MIIDIASWWYGAGLRQTWRAVLEQVAEVIELFSMEQSAKTLFAPFRQIDAGGVRGSIDVQLRAFFDRSFSRVFGFFIRSTSIVIGFLAAGLMGIIGLIWLIIWLILPFLPVIGVVCMLLGVSR